MKCVLSDDVVVGVVSQSVNVVLCKIKGISNEPSVSYLKLNF